MREAELKQALEKEKELNELKSRFVTMVSHEFRTPLSSILSSAEIIKFYKTEAQHPKRQKHVGRIKSSIRNLISILDDLLSLSKLEEGKVRLKPGEFSLADFFAELLEEVRGLLKTGQTLVETAPLPKELVFLDKHLLKNILLNLISNAIKYSHENQPIYYTAIIKQQQLHLEVRDEGIGIAAADQKYLFTRFYRATNADHIQGTGLGLNIVKRYVELLGGEISCSSTINKGSVFRFHIPLAAVDNDLR